MMIIHRREPSWMFSRMCPAFFPGSGCFCCAPPEDPPIETECCGSDDIPATLLATVTSASGCSSLVGVEVTLAYAGYDSGLYSHIWSGYDSASSVGAALICRDFGNGIGIWSWCIKARCSGAPSNTTSAGDVVSGTPVCAPFYATKTAVLTNNPPSGPCCVNSNPNIVIEVTEVP